MDKEKDYEHRHLGYDRYKGTRISQIDPNRQLSRLNKSGCSGVSWDSKFNMWKAHFRFQGIHYWVGRFAELNDAIKATKEKKKEVYSLVLSEHPVKTKPSLKHLPGTTIVDLTGVKKPHYEVIKFAGRDRTTCRWVCRCGCGNNFIATSSEIKNNKIISCGCVSKERKTYSYHLFSNYKDVFVDGTNLYSMNKNKPYLSNETSKVRGVYKPRRGSWYAKLTFQGVDHRIKCSTKEEAIKARARLEQEYYLPFMKKHKSVIIKVQKACNTMVK